MERLNKIREEKLQQENEFLKMKLMLEKGAHFGSMSSEPLPPEVENMFLKQVIAFEEGLEKRAVISLFDRIGRPEQFIPHEQIPDAQMESAWEALLNYLNEHQLEVSVCSPNVSARELYRFTTEELFKEEIEVVPVPGMVHCFIYDDYHPDPEYDNSRLVQEDLLPEIFRKESMQFDFGFAPADILFNNVLYDDFESLSRSLNRFKGKYETIRLLRSRVESSGREGEDWLVKGSVQAEFHYPGHAETRSCRFRVRFIAADPPFWVIKEVQLAGISL